MKPPIFKASKEDDLPKKMCVDCIVQIKNIYSFKEQCQKADLVLRTHILSKRKETEEENKGRIETENLQPNIEHLCQICKKIFTSKLLLDEHTRKIHKIFDINEKNEDNNTDQNYSCPQCGKK